MFQSYELRLLVNEAFYLPINFDSHLPNINY